MRIILTLLFFCFLYQSGTAQCEQKLNKAQSLYDDGYLEDVPLTLEGVEKDCEDANLERAYRLLIKTYLYLEQDSLSEVYYLKLLKLNPLYFPDTTEPVALRTFARSFLATPKFILIPSIGYNQTAATSIQQYSIDNLNEPTDLISNGSGLQFRVDAGLHFFRFIETNLGAAYVIRNIHIEEVLHTFNPDADIPFETLKIHERQDWIDLNAILKVNLWRPEAQVVPYVYGGGGVNFLQQAKFKSISRASVERKDIDVLHQRIRQTESYFYGAGVKFRVGIHHLALDARLMEFRGNIVVEDQRYANPELPFLFGHLDDDFVMRSFSLSIGYIYNFYFTQRLKMK